jgi:hypothetical protein
MTRSRHITSRPLNKMTTFVSASCKIHLRCTQKQFPPIFLRSPRVMRIPQKVTPGRWSFCFAGIGVLCENVPCPAIPARAPAYDQ